MKVEFAFSRAQIRRFVVTCGGGVLAEITSAVARLGSVQEPGGVCARAAATPPSPSVVEFASWSRCTWCARHAGLSPAATIEVDFRKL